MSGSHIQSQSDPLIKIQEEYLFHSLKNPKPAIESRMRQLRIIYQLNQKQYSFQKRLLPYIACGIFNPPYRKKENFAYTESFILDIDNVSSKMMAVKEVRSRIQADQRVMMCFTSPSEDGLKVMFRLKERCFDAGIYSVFYKEFARRFSLEYHLDQVMDQCTSDVSRACFVSMDLNAYFNPECEKIDLGNIIHLSDTDELFNLKASQDKQAKEANKQILMAHEDTHITDPDNEIMQRIKQCLHPNGRKVKAEKLIFVPQQLEEIMDGLKEYVEATGLIISAMINIQYGKKIRIKMGIKEAEINLFYGKRGFTIVKSPRCGTNEELSDLSAELIQSYILTL